MATRRTKEERIADLQAQIDKLKSEASDKGLEKAKVFANEYMHKLQTANISFSIGLKAYKAMMAADPETLASKISRAPRGTAAPKAEPSYVKGAHYKNPKADEVFPKKGGDAWKWARRPEWLATLIPDSMPFEEAKKAYAKLLYKGGDLVNNG